MPLIAIISILSYKLENYFDISAVKCIALTATLFNLFLSILLLINYNFDTLGYQFITDLSTTFNTLNQRNTEVFTSQGIDRLMSLEDFKEGNSNFDYYYSQFGLKALNMINWLCENMPGVPCLVANYFDLNRQLIDVSFKGTQDIIENIGYVPSFFKSIKIGVDEKSLFFILLTTFITPICILANWSDIQEIGKLKLFLILFLLLEILQIALFLVLDLFWFYIFFESVLIPLFLLIIIWGSSDNKYRAGFLLFLYTLFGSLFMLFSILWIKNNLGSTDFRVLSISLPNIEWKISIFLWLGFFIAFAIKTPLWPLNTWLINAHVEAPLGGSIVLAATILKLATYGFLRVLIPFFPETTSYFLPLVLGLSIISLIYASLSTIRQVDTKAVIAYSSVAHMAVGLLGLFSMTTLGYEGAIYLSLAHGFVSPALFICCGGIIYVRLHTRIIPYIKGLAYYMPIFSILFFIFILFNSGIPLSLNFLGEIFSLISSWVHNPILAILGASGIVLSACYSIFLFNRLSYGSSSNYHDSLKDIDRREFNLLISLLIPTLILGILPPIINYIVLL